MKAITIACTLLFLTGILSCSKQAANPQSPVIPTAPAPPPVVITIDSLPMNITTLTYNRFHTEYGGAFNIIASNALQKVAVSATNFWQEGWGNFMYTPGVVYSTRPDSLSAWTDYTTRDADLYFDSMLPLTDSITVGYFDANYNADKTAIRIKGNFRLPFSQ